MCPVCCKTPNYPLSHNRISTSFKIFVGGYDLNDFQGCGVMFMKFILFVK